MSQQLEVLGAVSSRGEVEGRLSVPGQAMIVERGIARLLILACPCGCADEIVVNLDRRAGPAWRLYGNGQNLSVFPSVWRESGCCSHFIIWRGRIHLFDQYLDGDIADSADNSPALSEAPVRGMLDVNMQDYIQIAERLDAIPWDVLLVCRKLVRSGLAVEGEGDLRGFFKQASHL